MQVYTVLVCDYVETEALNKIIPLRAEQVSEANLRSE
jgi:hypothetical protein